jgi:ketosteroid isomerase-like protein
MSGENVEIVRATYEAFNRGDLEAGAALFDPAIEWSTPPNLPEAGTWRGEEEVRRGIASFLESFESLRADVQELLAAPDGRVVSLVRFVGLGRDTGLPVEGVSVDAQVWTLRDGRVVRVEMYSGSADALQAVGLEPR